MSSSTPLLQYTLHLADDTLILGHRNSEWTGHGPILEQDIAISNIALDLIGQARNFYQYAAELANGRGKGIDHTVGGDGKSGKRIESTVSGDGKNGNVFPAGVGGHVTEDSLAYLRDGWDFRNSLLVEQSNGDWAKTILRQFFFSAHQVDLYQQLAAGSDKTLSAIGAKAYKEAVYHLRWSSEWVIRLGDGTEESHARMKKALDELWKFTGELYMPVTYEQWAAETGVGANLALLLPRWNERVKEVFDEAGLPYPAAGWMQTGGKEGRHTEQLGYILAEMQFLQRAYPGCEW